MQPDLQPTLVEFLKARLDELERRAQGSGRVAWLTYEAADGSMLYTAVASATIEAPDHWVVGGKEATGWAKAKVIYDERQVLADIAAKRRILDQLAEAKARCIERPESYMRAEVGNALLLVARHLALPYADHPDYDPEWRPA